MLGSNESIYEDYVRLYRIVHDVDPDPTEVSNNWPEPELDE